MSRHRPAPPRGGALIASALGCAAAARAGTPPHASGRVELIGDNGNRGDRLSRSAPLAARIGDRHVTTWSGFDTRSDTLEYRMRRRAWKVSASATGGQPREKGAYDVQRGNGTRRGTNRAASVVVAGEAC
jgi:hypothetical protein